RGAPRGPGGWLAFLEIGVQERQEWGPSRLACLGSHAFLLERAESSSKHIALRRALGNNRLAVFCPRPWTAFRPGASSRTTWRRSCSIFRKERGGLCPCGHIESGQRVLHEQLTLYRRSRNKEER